MGRVKEVLLPSARTCPKFQCLTRLNRPGSTSKIRAGGEAVLAFGVNVVLPGALRAFAEVTDRKLLFSGALEVGGYFNYLIVSFFRCN